MTDKKYTLGIDIGSTTVKIAILDEENQLLFADYERHFANIQETLAHLLGEAHEKLGELTLQPVIGQRKAAKATVHIGAGRGTGQAYVNGHNTADEGRELRRFDHVREDRRGGRGNKKPHGGLTVSGEMAAKQSQKPFKQRKEKGIRALPEGNPAAFRTWYVPEGVDTGPSGHRNAGPGGKPRYGKPGGKPGGRPGGGGGQGQSQGAGAGARKPRPYGHPGNAPHFPSDHATPGAHPGPARGPRGPRPGGNAQARPGGRPGGGGARPGGRPGGAPRGGNRGPRGQG